MNLTNTKLVFRNLWKEKITSGINIIGFAISVSICFVISVYVLHELSYDKFHTNYEKIYHVANGESNEALIDYTIKEEVLKTIPEIEDYCHILLRKDNVPLQYKNDVVDIGSVASVDNSFFNIFSFPIVYGNKKEPFGNNSNSIAISKSISQKMFGDLNPIGEKITLFNRVEYTVSAVYKDFPVKSSIYADVIRNEDYEVNKHNEVHCENGKCEYKRMVFLMLEDRTEAEVITNKINSQLAIKDKFIKKVSLQPFEKIYLHSQTYNNYLNKGNLALIKLMSGIALITLILASFNYINLSIAQYKKRFKEVGVRKTLGASRALLIRSFLTESILVSIISLCLALFITGNILPFFSTIFNVQISLTDFIRPIHLFIIVLSVLIISLINGIFPALIISSFNPLILFQRRLVRFGDNLIFKNVLTTFQFTVSIVLIICVLTIFKQLSFVKHKNLGFQDSYLLKISTNHITKYDAIKEEILQSPYILNASYSSGIPGHINWGFGAGLDAEHYANSVKVIGADDSFLSTLNIELLEGRDFYSSERDNACLVNEMAMKKFEWDTWQDKQFNKWEGHEGQQVIGIVKDFHYGSLYKEIQPLVITFQDHQKSFLSLRLSGKNIPESMEYIKKTWERIEPNVPMDYTFYDTWFDSMYKNEERLAKMVSTFALLAIIISCLGIFGQAVLNTADRIKEIGIRKVNGAKSNEIILLVNKVFVAWVLISLIIAIPVGRFIIHSWLKNFAYRTELSWWLFALAGIITLGIALLTVSWQSWRAASRNPVEALRYE